MQAATAPATTDLTADNNEAPTAPLSKSLDCGQLDLGRAALMMADRLFEPDNWIGHIPFAFWLIEAHRPNVLVELGTHTGNSYCAFCQAVSRLELPTSCTAVDSWGGDPQAGFYGEEIYRELSDYHDRRYASFSSLLRTTFDEAVEQFADGSIDLLHIDGFHTYDAVRHDFETWRAKLSDRAIVLFHDVNERGSDFGAWRVWEELTRSHPSFTFLHSHGLGVLAVGATQNPAVAALFAANEDETATSSIRTAFSRLGRGVNAERLLAREIAAHQELASGVASLAADRDRHANDAERLRVEHELLTREVAAHQELAAGVASLAADRDRHAHEAERLRVEHERLVAHASGLEATALQMRDDAAGLRLRCAMSAGSSMLPESSSMLPESSSMLPESMKSFCRLGARP